MKNTPLNIVLVTAAGLMTSIAIFSLHSRHVPPPQPSVQTPPVLPGAQQQGSSSIEASNKLIGKLSISIDDFTMAKLSSLVTGIFNIVPHQEQKTVLAVQATHDVATYTFLRDDQYAEREFKSTQKWSRKQLNMWAIYHCDIGIDLNQGRTMTVTGKQVDIRYPRPRVLSTELADFSIWSDDGWWNTVTEGERITTLKQLQAQVTQQAARQENLDRASQRFESHMRALIGAIDPSLSISFPLKVITTVPR